MTATSVIHPFRSCFKSSCFYEICLTCCQELREGFKASDNEAETSCQQPVERYMVKGLIVAGAMLKHKGKERGGEANLLMLLLYSFLIGELGSIPCPQKRVWRLRTDTANEMHF